MIAFDFPDQIVLVTGGASGLSYAIAEASGRAGATIALNDLTSQRVARATSALDDAGITSRGFAADVRDASAVRGMVDRVVTELGAPTITVANAGVYPNTPFLQIADGEWDRVLDTNVKCVFLTCQAAARAMVSARHGGQLVTIASGAANAALPGWSHYCASKAAFVMLTRAMALELGEHAIRVNAVLPGYIDVPEGGEHLDEMYKRAARTASPIGRAGEPEDIARAVLLLASPLADYVNGAAVVVDGGASAGRIGVRPVREP
jgi:3-oxoacyl-[acyl-carrier protein] reductase